MRIRTLLSHRFVRFLLVGVMNVCFGYVVFAMSIKLGASYQVALIISNVLGILFNFKSIGVIVFRSHNNKLITRFFLVYAIIYIVNVGFIALLKQFQSNEYILQALLAFPLGLLSYYLNKQLVFTNLPSDGSLS